jgi:predicted Fe-Mo cluster-binding NifX family protein
MRVCVPVDSAGRVDPRWGRAGRVAVAETADGKVTSWQEFDVGWDALHDADTEGTHHARVARFLRDHAVEAVVVDHMGQGMIVMLNSMRIKIWSGAGGEARLAVLKATTLGAAGP